MIIRLRDKSQWHRWFAWHPLEMIERGGSERCFVWLHRVWRRQQATGRYVYRIDAPTPVVTAVNGQLGVDQP